MQRTTKTALLAAFVVALGAPAKALDVPILGTKLVVKDTGRASKLVFRSKDPLIEVPDPAAGPDRVGAQLTILNPITGVSNTLNLSIDGWSTNRSGTTYRYKDALVKAQLRNRRHLKIKVKNTVIPIRDESQGTLGLRLEIGEIVYCAIFDPFSIRRDKPCVFIAKRAAAPVTCPSVTGSPSGAFVTATTRRRTRQHESHREGGRQ